MEIDEGQVPAAQAGGMAEGEDHDEVLREQDVSKGDALDDRVTEEELPGDES